MLLTLLLALLLTLLLRLQTPLQRLQPLEVFAGLVQRLLQLLFFGVVGSGCGLADLSFDIAERLLDFALIPSREAIEPILRVRGFENLFSLLHPVLQILALDRVGGTAGPIGGLAVFLIVGQGVQLIGHRSEFVRDLVFLLDNLLNLTLRIGARLVRELLRLFGDLSLLFPHALRLLLQIGEAVVHTFAPALIEQALCAFELFLGLLSGLLL
jgi:hypothetical protein